MHPMLEHWYRQLTADRRKLGLVVVLSLVVVVMWGRLLLDQGPSAASATPAEAVDEPLPDPGSLTLDPSGDQAEQSAVRLTVADNPPRDLFDTTRLLPEKKSTTQAKSPEKSADAKKANVDPTVLNLQSVMQGTGQRAMINDQIVTVGETIQGFTLKQVAARSVVVEKQGRQFRLSL